MYNNCIYCEKKAVDDHDPAWFVYSDILFNTFLRNTSTD